MFAQCLLTLIDEGAEHPDEIVDREAAMLVLADTALLLRYAAIKWLETN